MQFHNWSSSFSGLPQRNFAGEVLSFVMNILEDGLLDDSQEVMCSFKCESSMTGN